MIETYTKVDIAKKLAERFKGLRIAKRIKTQQGNLSPEELDKLTIRFEAARIFLISLAIDFECFKQVRNYCSEMEIDSGGDEDFKKVLDTLSTEYDIKDKKGIPGVGVRDYD